MSVNYRRHTTYVQSFHHEIQPEVPAQLLYASDDLGWAGVAIRGYRLAPYAPSPLVLAANSVALVLQGNVHLTFSAFGRKQHGSAYSGTMSLVPKELPHQFAWTNMVTVLNIHLVP